MYKKAVTSAERKYRLFLFIASLISIFLLGTVSYHELNRRIPDTISILIDKEETLHFNLPMEATILTEDIEASQTGTDKLPASELHLDLNKPVKLQSSKTGTYDMIIKLFGIFEFKKVSVEVIESIQVIPCGVPIGIMMETDGVLVLGNGTITSIDGLNYEPSQGILKSGDYIIDINGNRIDNKEDVISAVQLSGGNAIPVTLRRNDEIITVRLKPVKSTAGDYKIGAWIRDDTQGIGTLTFVTTTGGFGALGHGITDIDTGVLMEISAGGIYDAEVVSIVKGKAGEPGELTGYIYRGEDYKIGTIYSNTPQGVFGNIVLNEKNKKKLFGNSGMPIMDIGLKQEVKTGAASILCSVSGIIEEYSIRIDEVNLGSNNVSKGLVITITDERLINLTGGIVQGMSGSPIMQNGKLIGAVTHVFVRDSHKGYGTFIENMLYMLK